MAIRELLAKKPRWVFKLWTRPERMHQSAVERLRQEVARAAARNRGT
jgi:hypothetical protein